MRIVRSHGQRGYGPDALRTAHTRRPDHYTRRGDPAPPWTDYGQRLFVLTCWSAQYGTSSGYPARAVYDSVQDDGREAVEIDYL